MKRLIFLFLIMVMLVAASPAWAVDAPVSISGSWVSGTTHAKEAGSNRALIFIAHARYNSTSDTNITSVTYGGQRMTKVIDRINPSATSPRVYTAAFILYDVNITAASSATFTPTWSATPTYTAYSSVFLSNVDQTNPIGATDSNGAQNSATMTTHALATNNGDMVIDAATDSNTSTFTFNNSFTKAIEIAMTSSDGASGYKTGRGASETPSVTNTTTSRQVLIGFVVKVGIGSPILSASPASLNLGPDAGSTGTINITSDVDWTVSSDSNWLTVSPASGSNYGTVTVTAQQNTGSARTATVTVSGTGVTSQTVTVTQFSSTININCGDGVQGSFIADQYYSGGSTTSTTSTIDMSHLTTSPPPTAVLQTERYSTNATTPFTYTIPTGSVSSARTVTLYFDEVYTGITGSGQRIFDVNINGTRALTSFDIYASAGGRNIAIDRTFSTTTDGNGAVVILLTPHTQNAKVNGISVYTTAVLLSVSTNSLTIAGNANSTGTFDINSNTTWTVASDSNWLSVNPTSGSNNGTVTVTAQENMTGAARTAHVTVSGTGDGSQVVTVTQSIGPYSLSVSKTSLTVAPDANSSGTFDINSNTTWTVTVDTNSQSWLSVSPASGSNNGTITVTATSANTGTAGRTATVTVSGTEVISQTVTVMQSSTTISVNCGDGVQSDFIADQYYSGGSTVSTTNTIDMTQLTTTAPPVAVLQTERYSTNSTTPFTYTIPTGGAAGSARSVILYFDEVYSGITGTGQRIFDVAINGTTVLSNFDIYASAGGSNKAIDRTFCTTADSNGAVTILFTPHTQNAKICGIRVTTGSSCPVLNLSTTSVTVGSDAGSTGTFDINSNTTWTVSSNQTWLAVSPASGSNNGTVTVTAQQNNTGAPRTATVTINVGGDGSQTVTVTQNQSNLALNVSTTSLTIAGDVNSTGTFDINSNTTWTVASDQNWLSVSPASGSNNGTVTVTATSANTNVPRTAHVTVSGTGVASKTVTVTENTGSTWLILSTTSVSIAADVNSTGTFDINSSVSWTVSDDQNWLSVSPASGSNSGTVTVTATSANTGTSSRTAMVTVSGTGVDSQTVTVVQRPPGCTVPPMPSFSSLPSTDINKLQDPFKFMDGHRMTSVSDWPCRRAEIATLIQEFESGYMPNTPYSATTGSFSSNSLTVTVTDNNAAAQSFSCSITYPSSGTPPYPAVIGVNGESITSSLFTSNGVAIINFPADTVAAESSSSSRGQGQFYNIYGSGASASACMAWAWGCNRIIDAIEKTPACNIDPNRLAVTGCSRNGKGALFCAAFCDRIKLGLPEESGSGGSACWRVSHYGHDVLGQNIQELCEIVGENVWFRANFGQFCGYEDRLPTDHHELIGMIAPRACLVIENTSMDWLGNFSCWTGGRVAHLIWEAMGIPDHMGISQVGNHSHCAFPSSQNAIVTAYITKFLVGGGTADTNVLSTDETSGSAYYGSYPFDPNSWVNWVDWTTPTLTLGVDGADLNGDGIVNFEDYAIMANVWMSDLTQPNWDARSDISNPPDGIINYLDLEVLVENWLKETPEISQE